VSPLPRKRLLGLLAVAVLGACQQAPLQRSPGTASGGAPGTERPPEAHETESQQAPMPSSLPVPASAQQQAQKLATNAAGYLELGHEDQAKAELQRAFAIDPNNRLAHNLMRQINGDPVALLGRESFSYTVRANDSLSGLASRFLGDIYAFYILARYNSIAVPRQVSAGQTLRIPGKAPPPEPSEREARPAAKKEQVAIAVPNVPAPPPALAPPAPPPELSPGEKALHSGEAAERTGNFELALAEYRRAASLDQPDAGARAEQVRKQLVQVHTRSARTAFAKQDLDGAIRAWERVLEFDPANDTARLERQRTLALKEKVKKL